MSELKVPAGELLRSPGLRRSVSVAADLGPLSSADSQAPGPIAVELNLDALSDGVVVSGTISFDWVGPCRRCLEPTDGRAAETVEDVFVVDPDDDEDALSIVDGEIDLEPVVRELVLAALPLAPLCGPDCAGPDPGRFPTRSEQDLAEAEPQPDPRWAALDDLDLG